jgi:hypothetical protein
MKLSPQLTVNGEDRPVDITDETLSQDHVRDFPVPAVPDMRQACESGNSRRFASDLAPQRLVGKLGQFRMVLSDTRHEQPQSISSA